VKLLCVPKMYSRGEKSTILNNPTKGVAKNSVKLN
jgi:hypothetical protein